MVDHAIPTPDFSRESALTALSSRHFTFHLGQYDIHPSRPISTINEAATSVSFANSPVDVDEEASAMTSL